MFVDVEQLGISAGIINVSDDSITWADGNIIELLDRFARMVLDSCDDDTCGEEEVYYV